MTECVRRADASRGVQLQHVGEKVDHRGGHGCGAVRSQLLESALQLGRIHHCLGDVARLGKVAPAGPYFFVGGAHDLEDEVQLLSLGLAREEGLAGQELGEEAADGPHVDAGAVLVGTEEELRWAVPEGDDVVCVAPAGFAVGAGEAKVGDL